MFFPGRPLVATWSWSLICLTLNSLEAGAWDGWDLGQGSTALKQYLSSEKRSFGYPPLCFPEEESATELRTELCISISVFVFNMF